MLFTDHNGNGYYCSASVVNSAGGDIIWTAGHCVYGTAISGMPPGETWHSNYVFYPDYYDGSAPFGGWGVTQLWTKTNYINSQDLPDDMGVAIAATNSSGQHLVSVVGGEGIEWNFGQSQFIYDFGYPQAVDEGLILLECDGTEFPSSDVSGTSGLACPFTSGASGGPWLASFNGVGGYLDGNNSFTDSGFPGDIFSPYFGSNAESLFQGVENL